MEILAMIHQNIRPTKPSKKALFAIYCILGSGSANAISDLEYGKIIGRFLSAGVMLERAASGNCQNFIKNPHNSKSDIDKSLSITPARFHNAIIKMHAEITADAAGLDAMLTQELTSKAKISDEFLCGAKLGAASALYYSARNSDEFKRLEGRKN